MRRSSTLQSRLSPSWVIRVSSSYEIEFLRIFSFLRVGNWSSNSTTVSPIGFRPANKRLVYQCSISWASVNALSVVRVVPFPRSSHLSMSIFASTEIEASEIIERNMLQVGHGLANDIACSPIYLLHTICFEWVGTKCEFFEFADTCYLSHDFRCDTTLILRNGTGYLQRDAWAIKSIWESQRWSRCSCNERWSETGNEREKQLLRQPAAKSWRYSCLESAAWHPCAREYPQE